MKKIIIEDGKTSTFNNIPLTITIFVMMTAYAISATLIGPLITSFIEQYGISLSDNGLILFFQGMGGILSVIIGVLFADKIRRSIWVILTFGVYCLALLLLGFTSTYVQILILFFMIGASTKLLDPMLNAYISEMHTGKRSFYLSILHTCFGFGALVAPAISTFFVSHNKETNYLFLTLAAFCIFVFGFYLFMLRKSPPLTQNVSENKKIGSILKLFKNRNVILLFSLCFVEVVFAFGISTWIPSYMLTEMKTDIVFSTLVVSVLWIGYISGRIIHSFLSLRFKKRSLLIVGNLIGGTAIVIATLLNTPDWYIVGYFVSGFFMSTVIPFSMAMGGEEFPKNVGSVSSIIALGITIGLALGPWIVGLIADNIGFYTAIIVMSLLPYVVSVLSMLLSSRNNNQ